MLTSWTIWASSQVADRLVIRDLGLLTSHVQSPGNPVCMFFFEFITLTLHFSFTFNQIVSVITRSWEPPSSQRGSQFLLNGWFKFAKARSTKRTVDQSVSQIVEPHSNDEKQSVCSQNTTRAYWQTFKLWSHFVWIFDHVILFRQWSTTSSSH